MATIYDVPTKPLIEKVAGTLRKKDEIRPPEWALFVKTGVYKEKVPRDPDWWFIRVASILRKIYIHGPIGVEQLRGHYGGRERSGSKPEHFRKGSGSIVRQALQQLEKVRYVKKTKEGRVITSKGQSLLDKIATDLKQKLEKENVALQKY